LEQKSDINAARLIPVPIHVSVSSGGPKKGNLIGHYGEGIPMTARGEKLFDLLVRLSGIEKIEAETELTDLMTELGIDRENMTTEDVRKLVAAYLDSMQGEDSTQQEIVLSPMATELEIDDSSLLETNTIAKA
jgi:hypothetical protein